MNSKCSNSLDRVGSVSKPGTPDQSESRTPTEGVALGLEGMLLAFMFLLGTVLLVVSVLTAAGVTLTQSAERRGLLLAVVGGLATAIAFSDKPLRAKFGWQLGQTAKTLGYITLGLPLIGFVVVLTQTQALFYDAWFKAFLCGQLATGIFFPFILADDALEYGKYSNRAMHFLRDST